MKYGLSASNFKVYYETFKNPNNPYIRKLQLSNPFWLTERAKSHANYDKYLKYKDLADISTVAMIVDRKTNRELTQNDNLAPGFLFYNSQADPCFILILTGSFSVATITNPPGHRHPTHSMVLDCILVDVMTDSSGQQVWSNHTFKFKNTYKTSKQIEIPCSKIDFKFFF